MRALVPVALVLATCWPTLRALHERWTDWEETTYTHGYLVALICLYLIWKANRATTSVPARSPAPALVALGLAGLAWAFSIRAGIAALEWLLLPALLLLAIWAGCGTPTARRSAFAVGFLYFAMPLWDAVNSVFQGATVLAVRGMLRIVGIPSHFSGNFVQIPAGTFEIEGGCSGLHYAIVALALGALMGEVRNDNWRGRLKLLVLAGALAVLTNWIRVFTIILAGHFTDMQHSLVADSHYNYGWALFAGAMVLFFVIERRMSVGPEEVAAMASPGDAPGISTWRLTAPVLLVLAGVAILQWMSARPAEAAAAAVPAIAEWPALAEPETAWQPVITGADVVHGTAYRSPAGELVERRQYLFLAQRQGKELGGFGNDLMPGHVSIRVSSSKLAGNPATFHEVEDAEGAVWLVAETYGAGHRHFDSALPAQAHYAVLSLAKFRSSPAHLTLWRAPCVPDCLAARHVLERVAETMENDS